MKRQDDYQKRREQLANMDDERLKEYFWELAEKIVEPQLKLGYEYTSPSIERSVLLRMGFSSVEVKPIVEFALESGILGHGAGNIVYKLSKDKGLGIREVGLMLSEGKLWDEAKAMFEEAK